MITKLLNTEIRNRDLSIIYAIFFFSTIDLALTYYALSSGIAWESNPILRCFSLEGMGIVKALAMVILFYRFCNRTWALISVAAILALVCVWNILVITGWL